MRARIAFFAFPKVDFPFFVLVKLDTKVVKMSPGHPWPQTSELFGWLRTRASAFSNWGCREDEMSDHTWPWIVPRELRNRYGFNSRVPLVNCSSTCQVPSPLSLTMWASIWVAVETMWFLLVWSSAVEPRSATLHLVLCGCVTAQIIGRFPALWKRPTSVGSQSRKWATGGSGEKPVSGVSNRWLCSFGCFRPRDSVSVRSSYNYLSSKLLFFVKNLVHATGSYQKA